MDPMEISPIRAFLVYPWHLCFFPLWFMYCVISCIFLFVYCMECFSQKVSFKAFWLKFSKVRNQAKNKTKQNKKQTNKQNKTNKTFPGYVCLDHVDSFGKFLKLFVKKTFLTLVKKKGDQNTVFTAFSKIQYSVNCISLAKIV